MPKNLDEMTWPETYEEEIVPAPEKVTGYIGPNKDKTWSVFFTYEGPDNRFIFGVHRNISKERAISLFNAEKGRSHA